MIKNRQKIDFCIKIMEKVSEKMEHMEESIRESERIIKKLKKQMNKLRIRERERNCEARNKEEKDKEWKKNIEEKVERCDGWISERLMQEDKEKREKIEKERRDEEQKKFETREKNTRKLIGWEEKKNKCIVLKRVKGWEIKEIRQWLDNKGVRGETNIYKVESNETKAMVEFGDRIERDRIWERKEEIRREGLIEIEEWLTFKERRKRILMWLKAEEKQSELEKEGKRVIIKRENTKVEINGKRFELGENGELEELKSLQEREKEEEKIESDDEI